MFYSGIIVVCPTIHSRHKKYTMNTESRHFNNKPGSTDSDRWEILRIKTFLQLQRLGNIVLDWNIVNISKLARMWEDSRDSFQGIIHTFLKQDEEPRKQR